jgi:septum formation protein
MNRRFVLASASPRRAELLTAAGFEFDVCVADVDERIGAAEAPETYVRRMAESKALAVAARMPARLILGADTIVVIDGEVLGKPVDTSDARRMLRMLSGRRHAVTTGVALVAPDAAIEAARQDAAAAHRPRSIPVPRTRAKPEDIHSGRTQSPHARVDVEERQRTSAVIQTQDTGEPLERSALSMAPTVITRTETTTVELCGLSEAEIEWYVSSGEPRDKAGAYAIQGLASRYVRWISGSYTNVVGLPVALVYQLLRSVDAV